MYNIFGMKIVLTPVTQNTHPLFIIFLSYITAGTSIVKLENDTMDSKQFPDDLINCPN